jgi:hypothetical protein
LEHVPDDVIRDARETWRERRRTAILADLVADSALSDAQAIEAADLGGSRVLTFSAPGLTLALKIVQVDGAVRLLATAEAEEDLEIHVRRPGGISAPLNRSGNAYVGKHANATGPVRLVASTRSPFPPRTVVTDWVVL